jgi:hypothetical protein
MVIQLWEHRSKIEERLRDHHGRRVAQTSQDDSAMPELELI